MQILEIESSNEKEALKKASDILETDERVLDIRVHKKGAGGFLGIGSKDPSVYHIVAKKGETPTSAVIRGVIITLMDKMGYEVNVDSIGKEDDDKTYVVLHSDQAGHIIGKRGKTLESFQFIVNLMVQQFTGEPPKILLDIENYRERREKYLSNMAVKFANIVAKYGKSRLLEPLNPFERRLVHMALQEDERVSTESEGTGVYKRIRIKSTAQNTESTSAIAAGSDAGQMSEEEAMDEEALEKSILEDSEDQNFSDTRGN